MGRLIDADKIAEAIAWLNEYDFIIYRDVMKCINKLPTVEVVSIVRCKDCKFNYANQIPSENACQLCVELPISDEFYCAYGERIENEVD